MKTSLLFLAFLFLAVSEIFSQACGTSGPGQCTPTNSAVFTPSADIPCLMRGQSINAVWEFPTIDTIGQSLRSMRFDTIDNLPAGLCWSTNAVNDSFNHQEPGCILISGVTNALPGQYKLRVIATVDLISIGKLAINLDMVGVKFYLRLIDSTFSFCPEIDTAQAEITPYIPFPDGYQYGARMTGKLFFDANQNQVCDSGEQPISNQIVNLGGNYIALTNQSGNYSAYAPAGTYIIKPELSGNISGLAVNPDSITVVADTGVTYTNNNFGVLAPANYCEGSIAIIANIPPARPGFNNNVNVRFVNLISATAVTQTVQFHYDALQRFVSAAQSPASVDTVNRIVTWNLANISSGSSWFASVTLYTPPIVAIGTVLHMSAIVTSSTCAQGDLPETDEEIMVVGSYDPNDKAVSPVGAEPGGRIPSSTSKLSYTIRFQNTGTYLAENVNVVDTISPLLDLFTLKVQAASHSYEVLINGREVTFRFSQIMLADSNTNEPISHGYIKYSIQPTASFVQGSVIENLADIYFDFNSPIRTNTTQNRADNFIGIMKTQADEFGFEVYPNPLSSGNWALITDEAMTGKEMKIFDAAGRVVYSARIAKQQMQIDASRFSQGVYLVRIGSSVVRIIKL